MTFLCGNTGGCTISGGLNKYDGNSLLLFVRFAGVNPYGCGNANLDNAGLVSVPFIGLNGSKHVP